jgi:putative heme-binding domain-containing protein
MATSGTGHMPKLWIGDNESLGLKLVHDWIGSMSAGDSPNEDNPTDPSASFGDTSASLRLFAQLMFEEPGEDVQLSAAKTAAAEGNLVTTALFERFLPSGQRRKRLGASIDANEILAIKGNPNIGRERFFDARTGQCIQCHRLQGSGQMVGPDLDGSAKKRTRQELLESILEPSKLIEPRYNNYLVLTDDGNLVTGLKIGESDEDVVVKQADGKDRRIPKDEIESIKIQAQSLMPTGLAAEMTAQELADLLAFLDSLN